MREQRRMFIDKSGWSQGSWMSEPDECLFTHRGLRCAVRRDHSDGAFRGYVEVPRRNPHWDRELPVKVHGDAICLGERYLDGARKVLAFDCGHNKDGCPAPGYHQRLDLPYRTFEYAMDECRSLAEQVASATVPRVVLQDISRVIAWGWHRWLGAK